MNYEDTIGLEIHAELKTRTKMFCPCLNPSTGSGQVTLELQPNTNVCPICLAHPGVLPTINRSAVESVIKLGLALNGEILNHSRFDRKSYFYPDLPKGYQISQYELPLVKGGELLGVAIRRIHLEEDTARLLHDKEGSLVDFNRAGVPLIELVTEPVIDSAEKALQFGKELQSILRYLDISDADMEKGQFRVEANVSVAPALRQAQGESAGLGTKVELKNINSFRAVKNALAFEVKRQRKILEDGVEILQETRGWDEGRGVTVSQRGKEEAHDYRYLPEPDLPAMEFTSSEDVNLEELQRSLPELPQAKRERFIKEFGLRRDQVEVLIEGSDLAEFYEKVESEISAIGDPGVEQYPEARNRIPISYLTSDVIGILREKNMDLADMKMTAADFAELMVAILKDEISSKTAKEILREMIETGVAPHHIIQEKGLTQISGEEEIRKLAEGVIFENQDAVASYRKGKASVLQFLAGQVMAKAKGRANPQVVQDLLKKLLD